MIRIQNMEMVLIYWFGFFKFKIKETPGTISVAGA